MPVPEPTVFADERSLNQGRGGNLPCGVYGAFHDAIGVLVAEPRQPDRQGRLPADRAVGCPEMYHTMPASWTTLRKPDIKVELGVPAEIAGGSSGATSTTTTETR